jgi:hypothetical protein
MTVFSFVTIKEISCIFDQHFDTFNINVGSESDVVFPDVWGADSRHQWNWSQPKQCAAHSTPQQ